MEQSTEDFNFVDVDEGDDKVGASDMGAVEGVSRSIEEEKREKKRRRTTKPIEVLDMAGNVILSFQSGLECSAAINVTTGDISACCRGVKESVGGYRFRFKDEEDRNLLKKVGYGDDDKNGLDMDIRYGLGSIGLRSSRSTASRISSNLGMSGSNGDLTGIDFDQIYGINKKKLIPAALKSRKWEKKVVKIGNYMTVRWVPVSQELPTPELQELNKKDQEKIPFSKYIPVKDIKKRKSVGTK